MRRLGRYWAPTFACYLEPFCGSAALFFHLLPDNAILADLNPDLISFYEILQESPEEIYQRIVGLSREPSGYYECRHRYNCTSERMEKAALFYYLNKNCFNGLYRTNKLGKFNVPHSGRRTGEYPNAAAFSHYAELLAGVRFIAGDFEDIIKTHLVPNSLVYLDPPYASANRQPFKEYQPNSFSLKDLDRLENTLSYITDSGSYFVMSYGSLKEIDGRFTGWRKAVHEVQRNIAGFSGARKKSLEIVFTNISS